MLQKRMAGGPEFSKVSKRTASNGVLFFIMTVANKEIGKAKLTPQGIRSVQDRLSGEEDFGVVFRMDIELEAAYRGNGLGRQLLMHVLKETVGRGKWVELIDTSQNGSAKFLYGGEKTRANYDVTFNEEEKTYLIRPKRNISS